MKPIVMLNFLKKKKSQPKEMDIVLLQWLNQETSERSTQLWFDVTTEGLVLS
jgi:hypothetical protein